MKSFLRFSFFLMLIFCFPLLGVKAEVSVHNLSVSNTSLSMPLFFVPNNTGKGKSILKNNNVYAFIKTPRGTVCFNEKGAYIGIPVIHPKKQVVKSFLKQSGEIEKVVVIGLLPEGKNTKAIKKPVLQNQIKGKANFLIGDKKDWQKGVAVYRKVVYKEMWEKTDLEYLIENNKLEFKLILNPGADNSKIVFSTGADKVKMLKNGALLASLDKGFVYLSRPYAYQEIDGKKVEIPVRYKVMDNGRFSFELGEYDKSKKLVIDPEIAWSTLFGTYFNAMGESADDFFPNAVYAVKGDGDFAYITGTLMLDDFYTTPGVYENKRGGSDIYIAKVKLNEKGFVFSTIIGSSDDDIVYDMTLDSQGRIVFVGCTYGDDWPIIYPGTWEYLGRQEGDAFISRLSPDGNEMDLSVIVAYQLRDYFLSVTCDSNDNIITSGVFPGDLYVDNTPWRNPSSDSEEPVVVKLDVTNYKFYGTACADGERYGLSVVTDSQGNIIVSTLLYDGNTGNYYPVLRKFNPDLSELLAERIENSVVVNTSVEMKFNHIAIDSRDNVYLAVNTDSDIPSDFTEGYIAPDATGINVLILKYNNSLQPLIGAKFGGSDVTRASDITLGSTGNVYICGYSSCDDLPTSANAYQTEKPAEQSSFVAGFSSDLTSLIYSTFIEGSLGGEALAIDVDASGYAYIGGVTFSLDFPVTENCLQAGYAGVDDIALPGGYLVKLSPEGSSLLYSTIISSGFGVSMDIMGVSTFGTDGVLLSGVAASPYFPTTTGAFDTTFSGFFDGFIAALSPDGKDVVFSTFIGGMAMDLVWTAKQGHDGSIYAIVATNSPNFPVSTGEPEPVLGDTFYEYLMKFNSDCSSMIFSKKILEVFDIRGITFDSQDNVYIVGMTDENNPIPTTSDAFDSDISDEDGFFVVFSSNGTLQYGTYFGAEDSSDKCTGVDVDSQGRIYISLVTGSDSVVFRFIRPDTIDYFYDFNDVELNDVAVDGDGYIYVTGTTSSTTLGVTSNALQSALKGGNDFIVAKLDPSSANSLLYLSYLGGSGDEKNPRIAVNSERVVVSGITESDDFPLTPDAWISTKSTNSNEAGIIAIFPGDFSSTEYSSYCGELGDTGRIARPVFTSIGNVYVGGTTGSTEFLTTEGAYITSDEGMYLASTFIIKFAYKVLIDSSTEGDGTIAPVGECVFNVGEDATFTITPSQYNHIEQVYVDNEPVGAVSSYTFTDLKNYHTIHAVFARDTYTITATAHEHGSISPSGTVTVYGGDSITFTITPDATYRISRVLVDGVDVGAVEEYTFTNVIANHTIEAFFEKAEVTITATAHEGGSINPSGEVKVPYYGSQTFTITPDEGYFINRVMVDGENVGRVSQYTFEHVYKDHTIEAYFSTSLPPEITKAYADSTLSTSPREVKLICEAYDPDGGSIVNYQWEIFKDGELKDSVLTYTGECYYTFTESGQYTIKVTVIDDEGETATATLKDNQEENSEVIIYNPTNLKVAVPVPIATAAKNTKLTIVNIRTNIINPLSQNITLTLKFLKDGEEVSSETLSLPSKGQYIINPQEITGDYTDILLVSNGYLIVTSEVYTETGRMSAYITPSYTSELTIPHIAESTNWWDSSLFLCDIDPGVIYLSLNGEEYQHTNQYYSNIIELDQYIPENAQSSICWGSISTQAQSNPFEEKDRRLTGFETFVHNGTDGAAVELQTTGHTTLFIPHIPEETDIFWTGFAFLNPNEEEANLKVALYTSNGEKVGSQNLTIPGKTKISDLMKNLFPDYFGRAEWGIITSDKPIMGIEIYGTEKDGICGYSLPYLGQSEGILPGIKSGDGIWSGIALTNVSNMEGHITIQLIGKNGNVKAEKQEIIQSKCRFKAVLGDYFEGVEIEEGDYIKYTSDVSLIGIIVNGDLDYTYMESLTSTK